MPEVSRFYGIIIQIYFGDHTPAHFHALYGEHTALIDIQSLALVDGHLPPRALGLVIEWASLHQADLHAAFALAQQMQKPPKIAPLL